MRLWALSDLHLSHAANREALESFPAHPEDWLILAGDLTDGPQWLDWCFARLTPKFRKLVWVPGNHELWTNPGGTDGIRGVALYERLVGSPATTAFSPRRIPTRWWNIRTGRF